MFHDELAARHLWLMRQCLTRSIFEDGSIKPFDTSGEVKAQFDPYKRERGKDWPVNAETMIGTKRLENVHDLLTLVKDNQIPGAFVECGVWRGGVLMYATEFFNVFGMAFHGVIGYDSFEGLPEGGHYAQDEGDVHHTMNDVFAVGMDEVWANFGRYEIEHKRVGLVKGWFRDTCPKHQDPISILRVDGDMYEGTMDPLKHLYQHVSPGGFVIVDDFGDVTACRLAVTDFLLGEHGGDARDWPTILEVDHTGVYWQKR